MRGRRAVEELQNGRSGLDGKIRNGVDQEAIKYISHLEGGLS
jgi:hypothetical protein